MLRITASPENPNGHYWLALGSRSGGTWCIQKAPTLSSTRHTATRRTATPLLACPKKFVAFRDWAELNSPRSGKWKNPGSRQKKSGHLLKCSFKLCVHHTICVLLFVVLLNEVVLLIQNCLSSTQSPQLYRNGLHACFGGVIPSQSISGPRTDGTVLKHVMMIHG